MDREDLLQSNASTRLREAGSKSHLRTSLFDDDDEDEIPLTSKSGGSLHRHNWVEEQQKTLQLLHERSSEARANRKFSDASLTHRPSDASDILPQFSPSCPSSSTSPALDGPSTLPRTTPVSTRSVVSVAEGEDPLSAIVANTFQGDDDSTCPDTVVVNQEGSMNSTADQRVNQVEAAARPESRDDNQGGEATRSNFDDEDDPSLDDEGTRRRARRLAFSVSIVVPPNGRLGIGISELADGSVSVTRLDRGEGGAIGCAETSGLRLHDRLLGANFEPFHGGLNAVVQVFHEAKSRGVLHLQVLRDPALNLEPAPTRHYPEISRLLAQAGALATVQSLSTASSPSSSSFASSYVRSMSSSDGSGPTTAAVAVGGGSGRRRQSLTEKARGQETRLVMSSILGLLGRYEDASSRRVQAAKGTEAVATEAAATAALGGGSLLPSSTPQPFLSPVRRAIEKICLRAKGLREATCIRVVEAHLRSDDDTVVYALRVEDVESGAWWTVSKRYRELAALQQALVALWPPTAELAFPQKHITSSRQRAVIEERVLGLESFLRDCVTLFTQYACADARAGDALHALQSFVGVNDHVDGCTTATGGHELLGYGGGGGEDGGSGSGADAYIDDPMLTMPTVVPWVPSPLREDKSVELAAFALLSSDSSARDEANALLDTFHGNQIVERCLEEFDASLSGKQEGEGEETNGEGGQARRLEETVLHEIALRVGHLHEFLLAHHCNVLKRAHTQAVLSWQRHAQPPPPSSSSSSSSSSFSSSSSSLSSSHGVAAVVGPETSSSEAAPSSRTDGGGDGRAESKPSLSNEVSGVGAGGEEDGSGSGSGGSGDRLFERSVRRQCEAALYLPLRRFLPRALNPSLRPRSLALERKLRALRSASAASSSSSSRPLAASLSSSGSVAPVSETATTRGRAAGGGGCFEELARVLHVDARMPSLAPREWKKAVLSFERFAAQLLPCDMVTCLCEVSRAVLALHGAVSRAAGKQRAKGQLGEEEEAGGGGEGAQERGHEEKGGRKRRGSKEGFSPEGEAEGGDARRKSFSHEEVDSRAHSSASEVVAMSADDFLPVFTLVLIQAETSDLLCTAELCSHLLDPDEAISERGYCVASLQAALHIVLRLELKGQACSGGGGGGGGANGEADGDSDDDTGKELSLVRPLSLPSTRQSWALR